MLMLPLSHLLTVSNKNVQRCIRIKKKNSYIMGMLFAKISCPLLANSGCLSMNFMHNNAMFLIFIPLF